MEFFINSIFIISQLNLMNMIILSLLGIIVVYRMEGKDKIERVIIYMGSILLGIVIYVFFRKSTITLSISGMLLFLFGIYINVLNIVFKLVKKII